jgi:Fe-S cluster biogenesis protein NfuA
VFSGDEADVVKRIQDILDNYVKPAVEMDGGAIQFKSFKDGKVWQISQLGLKGRPKNSFKFELA